MSLILIAQPTGAVHELFHIVLGLHGHEALDHDAPGAVDHSGLDVLIVDPSWPDGLGYAQRLRNVLPELPIICISVHAPTPAAQALQPVAHLSMPFPLGELDRAVELALDAGSSGACG